MDFSKFETKEDVLEKIRKLRDKLEKVDSLTAELLRRKIRALLDFYKHFEYTLSDLM